MNSKSLRRLAADHATLHSALPPNYLFPTNYDADELTQLDVLLAGPEGTPYATGLYKLHLEIPAQYPSAPPTAQFRTRIWHPNVEEATGAVCVDTLKRDWQNKLTLKDVLVTISCLLIQPNPASALNAEAGALLQEDWDAFCRRAKLMTGIHAQVPRDLRDRVLEARARGEDKEAAATKEKEKRAALEVAKSGAKKGKARVVVKEVLVDAEDGEENARRTSEDWIPAPAMASLPTPLGLGMRRPLGELSLDEPMEVDEASAQVSQNSNTSNSASNIQAPVAPAERTASTRSSDFAVSVSSNNPAMHTTPLQSKPSMPSFTAPLARTSSRRSSNHSDSSQSSGHTWEWAINQLHSTDRHHPDSAKKERHEERRMKAAGYCLKRYNRGAFGPRKGLKRL